MSGSRRAWFAAKLSLGVVLLGALLLFNDNWRSVLAMAAQLEPDYLLPFFGISVVAVSLKKKKWQLFLSERGADLPILRLMQLYVIGFFFNNFFPSNFGGDTVRSYILGKQIRSQERALASVFLERFTGFIAMVSLAVGAFLTTPELRRDSLTFWSILIVGLGCLGVLAVVWRPGLASWMLAPLRRFDAVRTVEEKAAEFHSHVVHFRSRKKLLALAMIYSYGFYASAAISVYFAGLLLGVECSLPQLMVVTPIVMLIASFPLTPNSMGVWEWAFSIYLTSAGATTEQGLAIALALRAKNLIISLLGGLLFLFESGGRGLQRTPPRVAPEESGAAAPCAAAHKE